MVHWSFVLVAFVLGGAFATAIFSIIIQNIDDTPPHDFRKNRPPGRGKW